MQLAQSQKIIVKKQLELASSKRISTGSHELKRKIETEIAKLEVLCYIQFIINQNLFSVNFIL
jgi:hypothetical protein